MKNFLYNTRTPNTKFTESRKIFNNLKTREFRCIAGSMFTNSFIRYSRFLETRSINLKYRIYQITNPWNSTRSYARTLNNALNQR